MTLISEIIREAYRENNTLAIGGTLSVDKENEGLRLYNRLVSFLIGNVAGENLADWPLGNFGRDPLTPLCDYQERIDRPLINRRLIATQTAAKTVYMPVKPSDGSRIQVADPHSRLATYPITLDANGRTIEGQDSLLLDTDGLNATWFYRADLVNWVRLTALEATDATPFPDCFDDMQIILLTQRLNPRAGKALNEQSAAVLEAQSKAFLARYTQQEALKINPDLHFMSVQSFDGWWDGGDDEELLYGRDL